MVSSAAGADDDRGVRFLTDCRLWPAVRDRERFSGDGGVDYRKLNVR